MRSPISQRTAKTNSKYFNQYFDANNKPMKTKKIAKTVTLLESDLVRLEKLREKEQPASSIHAFLSWVLKEYKGK
jgi:hypothetical protein